MQLEELIEKEGSKNATAYLEKLIQKEWKKHFNRETLPPLRWEWGKRKDMDLRLYMPVSLDFEQRKFLVVLYLKREDIRGMNLVVQGTQSEYMQNDGFDIYISFDKMKRKEGKIYSYDQLVFNRRGNGFRLILNDQDNEKLTRTFSIEVAKDFIIEVKKLTREHFGLPNKTKI
jgi:hypothetical protein